VIGFDPVGGVLLGHAQRDWHCVSGHHDRCRAEAFQAGHRSQPCLQPSMIGFDPIVGVLLGHVRSLRHQIIEDSQVSRRLVGGDLDRRRPGAQCLGEEPAGWRGVPPLGQQDVDDLPVLVDRAIKVRPPAGDLDVGLIHEPPITGSVPAGAGGVREQRCEPLHPPEHGHVVDAALGQQFLDIAVGEAVAQVPADRQRDHLRRELEPGERRPTVAALRAVLAQQSSPAGSDSSSRRDTSRQTSNWPPWQSRASRAQRGMSVHCCGIRRGVGDL
jgi:hypothetical protein